MIEERGRETQRLHKVLEDAGVKLSSVASSVLTMSGREMIEALIAGQRDPAGAAEMAKGRMRSKIPQLEDALAGRFNDHHALLCRAMLARIEELLDPHEAAVRLLVGIPGVSYRTAQVILAEIDTDMSRFPTPQHPSNPQPEQHRNRGSAPTPAPPLAPIHRRTRGIHTSVEALLATLAPLLS